MYTQVVVSTTPSRIISPLGDPIVRIILPFKTVLGVEGEDLTLKILLQLFGPLDNTLM